LTIGIGNVFHPVWTPDGRQVAFDVSGSIYLKAADGSGAAELLWASENEVGPMSWSPAGLLAFEDRPPSGIDIWVLNASERSATPFLDSSFNEVSPMFSPDGRFLAYVSDESGGREVYVQPYPGPGGKLTISTDGGQEPVWSADGRELFYRSGSQMLAVAIQTEPTFRAGKPRLLFEGNYQSDGVGHPYYHVSPDGQRFLMVRPKGGGTPTQLYVVLNWGEELQQLVPRDN
jgi:serine/threonine-protein kinase